MQQQEQLLAASKTEDRVEKIVELGQRICAVASPTGQEHERAQFVASLLRERGYQPEIDEIGNVYTRRGQRGNTPLLLVLAHTDTVFPQGTPIKIERDKDILRGPGIGDNSISVAAAISALDLLDELGWETNKDLVFVANVGEEGLGNLRGARAAVERYREQLGAVIALDGRLGSIVNEGVGSKRWRINVDGPGGHSYANFGTPSAIHGLAHIISAIADIKVPETPKITYNIGEIEGGTSINTIAAHASALLDMRSNDPDALNKLSERVQKLIEERAGKGLQASIEVLGERPAGKISREAPLIQLAAEVLRWLGIEPRYYAASTDINIPLSLAIPAVCVGLTQGDHEHTLKEYLKISPIGTGFAQFVRLCLEA
jgi:acetylornithine deacetylase/succinyl-diaminopimelate desuccinylase-like protein